jgi:DNA-binding transcriptional MerR regulator
MTLHGLPPAVYRGLLLSVGSRSGTRPMSPAEVARALKSAQDNGTPAKDLAAALQLEGTTMISRFLRVLSLPPDVQLSTDWGRTSATIAFTSASELARLKGAEEQLEACRAALEHELSTSEVKALVQLRQRSRKSIAECVGEIVRLRPEVQRRHVFIGGIIGDAVQRQLEARSQLQRDDLMKKAAHARYPDARDVAVRLGSTRFTLAGDEELARHVLADPEGFEAGVNSAISQALELEGTIS